MGSLVALQMAVEYPELLLGAIPMGTAARPTGFSRDWMMAEVEFCRAGGKLSPDFAVHHYGAFMFPSEVLGDDELWYRLRPFVERSYAARDPQMLIAQWEACIDFDVEAALASCQVPIHVIGFSQDMQTPPALGRRAAELAPRGVFHLLEGLGHLSLAGHRTETVNGLIREILADLMENA
jgi:pimeloyl-ACP methyl ester carboxylesterase